MTYAYPQNEVLDFNAEGHIPKIHGDYFQGGFLRFIPHPEHPLIQFPYFESTIELRSGASGGPVFDSSGRVIAVNCRGWDFGGGEHEGQHLSYLVPISHLLDVEIDPFMVPPNSWEAAQMPDDRTPGQVFTISELASYGHVQLEAAVQ